MTRRLAVSDVHGHLDPLTSALAAHEVVDAGLTWTGGATRLWFLGDYLDRGDQGLEVVDLVRRLEREAADHGGSVEPLMGNHELQFLAALHFGDRELSSDGRTPWRTGWLRYGGIEEELRSVDEAMVDWLTRLPLVDRDGRDLLLHSDTDAYLRLGRDVEEINAAGRAIVTGRDPEAWALLHRVLVQRAGFRDPEALHRLLDQLGARRVVHGHTSLIGGFGLPAAAVDSPLHYASGRAAAIDGGVFEGGSVLVLDLGS